MSKERYELRYVGDWYCYVYDNEKQQGADICSLDDSVRIFNEQDKKIKDLETKLADLQQEQVREMQEHQEAMKLADKTIKDTEEQNKRVLEKLELIVRANQELEQKLAESFTEKDVEGLIKDREETIKFLKKQLAEKDKEILNLKNIVDGIDTLKQYDKDAKQIILINPDNVYADGHRLVVKNADQDKISFCIEQLEKVRKFAEDMWGIYKAEEAIEEFIKDQIKQLKEGE